MKSITYTCSLCDYDFVDITYCQHTAILLPGRGRDSLLALTEKIAGKTYRVVPDNCKL